MLYTKNVKKLLFSLVLLITILAIIALLAWNAKASVAASILHRHLGTPVTIESLDLTRQSATIANLSIGNPPHYQSSTSFTARTIDITTTLDQLRANPLLIDEIVMDDLFINVETQKNGETNWNEILSHRQTKPSTGRHYLIKTLIMRNLNVSVTSAGGETKRYPALARLEFHNISDETGFPVSEIEKAIFNQMMQNLYKQLDLEKMLKPIIPGGQFIPGGILPNLFK